MLVPVIMGFIMVNAFALSFIFIHKIEENIQPILLNFFRSLIAVLIISMIFLIGFNFEELKVLGFKFIIFSGASGICGVVLGDIVFMYSQKKISPP